MAMRCDVCGAVKESTTTCSKCAESSPRQQFASADSPIWPAGVPRPVIRRRSAVNTAAEGVTPDRPSPTGFREQEDNLIRFPYTSTSGLTRAAAREPEPVQDWRQMTRDRVRESRERRAGDVSKPRVDELADEKGDSTADVNPIVESALKRLRDSAPAVKRLADSVRGSTAVAVKPAEAEHLPTQADSTGKEVSPLSSQTRTDVRNEAPLNIKEHSSQAVSPGKFRTDTSEVTPSGRLRERVRTRGSGRLKAPDTDASVEREPGGAEASLTTSAPAKPRSVRQVVTPREPGPVINSRLASEVPIAPTISPPRVTNRLNATPEQLKTLVIEVPRVLESASSRRGEKASFWVRTLAAGCDLEIVALAFLPVFASYAGLNTSLETETLLVLLLLFSLLTFFYYGITLSLAGRTYGMAILNLRLVSTSDESGEVSRRQRLLRAWSATIAFLLPPINLLASLSNGRGLSFPDLVSGTIPVED